MATKGRFAHVRPGAPLTFRADDHNDWQEAAKAHRNLRTGTLPENVRLQNWIVTVYNNTGGDLDAGRMGYVFPDMDISPTNNDFILDGGFVLVIEEPGLSEINKPFVITAEPIADGAYGRGIIGGVCRASVHIVSQYHDYAYIQPYTNVLRSGFDGPAKIIWKPTSEDVTADCLIQFPANFNAFGLYHARNDDDTGSPPATLQIKGYIDSTEVDIAGSNARFWIGGAMTAESHRALGDGEAYEGLFIPYWLHLYCPPGSDFSVAFGYGESKPLQYRHDDGYDDQYPDLDNYSASAVNDSVPYGSTGYQFGGPDFDFTVSVEDEYITLEFDHSLTGTIAQTTLSAMAMASMPIESV